MPHIDEGLLHWYLDEYESTERSMLPDELRDAMAHVDQCTDCTMLLEEARTIRVGARGILSGAQPAVEKPPFEQVVETANARRREHRQLTWMRRSRTLGLAATVVLAVGAGWVLRARFPSSEAPQPEPSQMGDPNTPPIAELQASVADSVAADGRLELAQPTDQLEERDQTAKQVASTTEATAEGAGARTDQPAVALRRQVAPAAAAAPREREEAVRGAQEAPAEPVARDVDVAAFANVQTPPLDSVAMILEAAKADDEFKDTARVIGGVIGSDDASSWILVDRATAEQEVGPLAIIPAASIESIRMGERFGTTAILISQRAGDAIITLLEWRIPRGNEEAYRQMGAASPGRESGDAASQIVVRTVGDLFVAARADVSPDSLAVLLDLVERK